MFYKLLKITTFSVIISFWVVANGQNRDVQSYQQQLRKIRNEIRAYEDELSAKERKESTLLHHIQSLDLDIDLTQHIIQKLKKEAEKKRRQIAVLQNHLKETRQELERLKKLFAKRIVYFYKYGRIKDLELLFSAKSINQGLLWIEYQKRLSQHDYRNYLKIKEKQEQIIRDKDLLAVELEEQRQLLKEKLAEEKKLKAKKQERQKLLASVRKDKEIIRQQLIERQKAAAEIRRIIFDLEREPVPTPVAKPGILFHDLKGHMPWPTEGKIIGHFGKYVHPELKTVTENLGIDIQAPLGTPVQAVADGRVTAITWQRGRGSIIIISHYGGYYSVYTHLQEILVDLLDEVSGGQIIGTVGESGSLEGPMLHFEIWKGTKKLNPEEWLMR
ncbi:MAG: hypothetical protein D6813_00360 [Calditrichaeota bacterium]|nr:MAG: hypothetical protein D6813_00360 [Calditrichota bacterium]